MQVEGYNVDDRDRDEFLLETDWNSLGFSQQFDRRNIPTMSGVAEKIASEKGIIYQDCLHLQYQYTAYEIICSSFMLSMVNEGWEGDGASTDFIMNHEDKINLEMENINDKIIRNLKKIGAKDQLIMFITTGSSTGPTGAGKSTVITVAQRFCSEFSKSLGVASIDNIFLFTAKMTGCAASLFGGMTIHSAAHLQKRKNKFSEKFGTMERCQGFDT
jgi:hypothetical protein